MKHTKMLALGAITLAGLAPVAIARVAPGSAEDEAATRVHGRVIDVETGAGVADAEVFVAGTSTSDRSDRDGRFRLVIPDARATDGTVELIVRHGGYAERTRRVEVEPGRTTNVDIAIEALAVELRDDSAGRSQNEAQASKAPPAAEMERRAAAPAPAAGLVRGTAGRWRDPEHNTESYAYIDENGWRSPDVAPLSTFSIDVDRASYANVRRFIESGQRPPIDAVRIEELINYFPYGDAGPDDDAPFAVATEVAPAPWKPVNRLVRIGIQGRTIDLHDLPASNLVFLLDVSGSMQAPDKLPLLKRSLRMLVRELREEDRVAIVVYAGAAGLVLEPTSGHRKRKILGAIERLEAGGSTAGGAGLGLAYRVAREHFVEGGNNRIILATDGDFNVGPSSDAEMTRLIERERRGGTFLTVLGFGTGNLKDSKMESIADHGNGNYAYIDNLLEARKVLVTEMGGTLVTIAKDVKIQIEFNPALVQSYRLIGYENRLLADEDFNDDAKDAGELGAGHSVTALYEIVPAGADDPSGGVDPLRYGSRDRSGALRAGLDGRTDDELLFVKLRYKAPDGEVSRRIEQPVAASVGRPSEDHRFAAAVAAFGMLLRDSEECGDFTLRDVVSLASSAIGDDPEGYRADFVRLVELAVEREVLSERVR